MIWGEMSYNYYTLRTIEPEVWDTDVDEAQYDEWVLEDNDDEDETEEEE